MTLTDQIKTGMKYSATITQNENSDYRIVLVDKSTEHHFHTAIECPDIRALLFAASKTIEERERSKLPDSMDQERSCPCE